MRAYHDREWGVPLHDPRALWEALVLEGFQGGLSWAIVLRKREGLRRAFAGFDPVRVAAFDAGDVARLMADPGIIRARAKIEATIASAGLYLALQAEGQDFARWGWSFAGEPEAFSKALKARGFKFTGPTIVQSWMQAVGMIDGHAAGCFLHKGG